MLRKEQLLPIGEMARENSQKLAEGEAKTNVLELTENISEAPDEFHETLSLISKHSRETASQRVSDAVNNVNAEPSQTITTESKTVAERLNPPTCYNNIRNCSKGLTYSTRRVCIWAKQLAV